MNIFYPMAFYILYIWFVVVLNFVVRKKAIRGKEMSFGFFRTYKGEATDRVLVVGRHLDNQFQLPPIFLITCLSLHVAGAISPLTVSLAWGFVASRVLHSFIHLGENNVLSRVKAYALGWFLIMGMWLSLVLSL